MGSLKKAHPALYRAYQFFVAVQALLPGWAGGSRAELSRADRQLLQSVLPQPAQQQLFARMTTNDQRHALAVARSLQQAGHQARPLLQAALLHDVGKCIGQPIIHRVLIVLLEAFWPAMLPRLAALDSSPGAPLESRIRAVAGWRRPFVVHAHHPALGAAWARLLHCAPEAVRLIDRHQTPLATAALPEAREQEWLALLQAADDLN